VPPLELESHKTAIQAAVSKISVNVRLMLEEKRASIGVGKVRSGGVVVLLSLLKIESL
jgi:hypothetical protein